jgi:subtilisin family serine protease
LEVLESRALLSGSTADGLFVRFAADAPPGAEQAALSALRATVVEQYPDGPLRIRLGAGIDGEHALQWLDTDPYVSYAEGDSSVHAASAVVPNDPYFNRQWGLSNANNVDIDAPQAWGITQGRYSVVVAVLDTGIDLRNVDLASRLWTNPTGASGADGYPGDVHGWNFVSGTSNIQDYNSHGTHVAGILAGAGNNGYGVAGVDWNAKLMVVKVLDNNGDGSTDAAVSGIYYAVQHGARVINASWGGGDYSQAMHDAIAYAGAHGVVFVTAAGNDGTNSDNVPSYPGSYRLSNEITVGAVDSSGRMASFSDYGAHTVDLVAPGVNIWSTIPGSFESISGTSMATPYVTGVVALVLSVRPNLSAPQLVQRILATVKPLGGAAGRTITGGIVDAYNAVDYSIHTTSGGTGTGTGSGGGSSTTGTLVPGKTSDEDVLARILATDDFYRSHGATLPGFVSALYNVLLDRGADAGGLNYWVGRLQSGQTRLQVAEAFERTAEAQATKVAHWYQDLLGWTTPLAQLKLDPGVAYWSTLLAAGQTDNAVLARILATDDFWAAHGASNTSFVAALYQSVLGRTADPGGLNYFAGLLRNGASRQSVVQAILGTAEAKQAKVARWYQEVLGWNVSLATLKANPGVGYWAGFLTSS